MKPEPAPASAQTPRSMPAANAPNKLPPPLFDERCKACWLTAALLVLVVRQTSMVRMSYSMAALRAELALMET